LLTALDQHRVDFVVVGAWALDARKTSPDVAWLVANEPT
jgi:hypothetical protein